MCECHLRLHVGSPSTQFSTSETQNSCADSNQESIGILFWAKNCCTIVAVCVGILSCSRKKDRLFCKSDLKRAMRLLRRSKMSDKKRHWLCVLQAEILGAQHLYYQKTRSASSWFLIFETSIFSASVNSLHTRLCSPFHFWIVWGTPTFITCDYWIQKIWIMCNRFKEVFCMNNTLFPMFCCQRMRHKSCTQFSFFKSSYRMRWKIIFLVSVYSSLSSYNQHNSRSSKQRPPKWCFHLFSLLPVFRSALHLQSTPHPL